LVIGSDIGFEDRVPTPSKASKPYSVIKSDAAA